MKGDFSISRNLSRLNYVYIVLPVLLFFVTWTWWPYAVLMGALLAAVLFSCLQDSARDIADYPSGCRARHLWMVILLSLVMTILAGIGGFTYQNLDHYWRNGLLRILVEYDWPVVYDTDGGDRGLFYYLGFWMPAALVGKAFGPVAAEVCLVLWTALGLVLVWYNLCRLLNKASVWIFVAFMLFSGLDAVSCLVYEPAKLADPASHIEWTQGYQISSFTTQLFWVFNQAVPCWVIFTAILAERSNRHVLFLWSCALLQCTFPSVGMIPYIVYLLVRRRSAGAATANVVAACVTAFSLVYLSGNEASGEFSLLIPDFSYFVLLAAEAGIYLLLIVRYDRGALVWITAAVLAAVPLVLVGNGGDFCMRVGIPAQLALFILFADCWLKAWRRRDRCWLWLAGVVFATGSITASHEIYRTLQHSFRGDYENSAAEDSEVLGADKEMSANFSGKTQDNLFYEYVARN